ncbi:hypothetical protein Tco_0476829, partial [Tanacetum coccineum]
MRGREEGRKREGRNERGKEGRREGERKRERELFLPPPHLSLLLPISLSLLSSFPPSLSRGREGGREREEGRKGGRERKGDK